ncbi:CamS family sex pheromone protein [Loigolactobacillus backii]|uniref:CamS family sex pheromone protein n=1 Tax=Loigolactobacillus backii TaxID=375175 RepID=A0A192H5H9_9LACO|nr:CamS family sex pheromone protein [Loigolactobacillus backii]ANK63467.1 CamS family sex pheromone protein [Loigolactobacillus backii]ANK69529.1 CamS family sex pheromone protein [Loigolactobacillus backii]MDA5387977.1 CamS family sex pheromone protein [Loigolactobacillus backii]MDA5390469.1 CamS family sex pheromone protein [Loigolactobacillus backii]PIO83976.1 CamS family sex pheromone protein [Loigolactobacillus backii]
MKRAKAFLVLFGSLIFLAGCGNLQSSGLGSGSGTKSKSSVQTTGQVSDSDYQGVVRNGKYLTSKSRGLSEDQNTNGYNLKSFESGLLTVSKKQFPTNKYVFQEGQYLNKTTVTNWLARKSKDNPDGLNPASNGQTDANKRNPIYLQQLEEQDYMTQSGSKLSLGGVTIGLGMNQIDYYTKKQYGPTYQTKISNAQMVAEAKKMANEVVKRMRAKSGMSKVPITIALYEQAPNDSLVGGTFFANGTSKNGSKTISSWNSMNQKNYTLPAVSGAKSGNSSDSDAFDNFKTQIQSFFPNLSGVTAQTHYNNGTLAGMNVSINTQFYSQTEIMSFTQFIATEAEHYLPSNVPIQVTISSSEGIQSFVARDSGQKSFYTHVFGSY